jgi:hypothetical protein
LIWPINARFLILKVVLKSGPTVSRAGRTRLPALLHSGLCSPKAGFLASFEKRLIRRAEAARCLGCSLLLVDRLAKDGLLLGRRLLGRVQAAGFLEVYVLPLVTRK